jgi:hypothetical protein
LEILDGLSDPVALADDSIYFLLASLARSQLSSSALCSSALVLPQLVVNSV